MTRITHIACACRRTRLELEGSPILVSECLCNSRRAAGGRLAALPGARNTLIAYHATASAEYRKDRVRILAGMQSLKEFRLSPTSSSRRVVATCCNTPVFLVPHLSETTFPEGHKAGWWMKAVQLDLEAKGIIRRAPKRPVQLYRVA